MSRFDELVSTVDEYQKRAAENYSRIRALAEEISTGFCAFLGNSDGVCVHLVSPTGAFTPKPGGDAAFSVAPRGFRPLGPIIFGLAVRVTRGTDWIRLTLHCRKAGHDFVVQLDGGPAYTFHLPLEDHDKSEFYELLYAHILSRFTEAIERYDDGDYASRSIGFDFTETGDTDASRTV